MQGSKVLSASVSFLISLFLVVMCFGFTACACTNRDEVTVSVKQICDGVEGEYANIEGAGRYLSSEKVTLKYSNMADGYYFYCWKVGQTEYKSTELNQQQFTKDTEVVAVFGKGAEFSVGNNRVMIKNGEISETTSTSVFFKLNNTVSEDMFSYWKITYLSNGSSRIFSADSESFIEKENVNVNIIFEPVCANCGVMAIYYESNTNDVASLGIRGLEVYSYSEFKNNVISKGLKYAFLLEPYAGVGNLITNIGDYNNSTLNQTNNIVIPMTKSYTSLSIGKIFWDMDGNLKCALLGGMAPVVDAASMSGGQNIVTANKPDGTAPTLRQINLIVQANRD